MVVDLNTGNTTLLKVSVSETCNGPPLLHATSLLMELLPSHQLLLVLISMGIWVYVGNSKGEILIIDYKDGEIPSQRYTGKHPVSVVMVSGVVGGSASKGEHKIYIWDRAGHLVKILEGPKEALIDLAWHPVKSYCCICFPEWFSLYMGKRYNRELECIAPDFKELEENEEYVEREDEFDLIPETEKGKGSDVNEDEEVDIVAVEKDTAFSDSDMSQEELCFLPATPSRDAPEAAREVCGKFSKMVTEITLIPSVRRSWTKWTYESCTSLLEGKEAETFREGDGVASRERVRNPSNLPNGQNLKAVFGLPAGY
ncbi:Quinoprotein alcohol dehydrogenase-like superfamily, partial [Sesbania bispinosa]